MADFNLVYRLEGKIYINLTNKCTNNCVFCIRAIKDDVVGADLFLKTENFSAQDVIDQLKKFENQMSDEIVFCGYGEPIIKLDILKEVAKYIKENYKGVKVRVNTNGQGNLIHKRDIVPELKGLIDKVSISLNGENEEEYERISKPNLKNTYSAVKDFIKECAESGIDTTATVVSGYKGYEVNVKNCEEITKSLGAKFRERPWIENGY